jgi:GH25 family lysozyme M1 (1,4-beta-N-acetylmuramidase)
MTILGIDISDAQGVVPQVQWQAVALDKKFVYNETRIGNDSNSKYFDQNVAGQKAAGLTVGAYLFAYILPNAAGHAGRDPESQAQAFFEAANGLGGAVGELCPMIDCEWPAPEAWGTWGCSPTEIQDWICRCASKVQALFGRTPGIYTYPFWATQVGMPSVLAANPLWLAAYGGSSYKTVSPWTSAAILQTGNGTGPTAYRLPNGSPCDEDAIVDAATFAMLTGQVSN